MLGQYVALQKFEELEYYLVSHPQFEAKISKFGGQLLAFKTPKNKQWLWLSESAVLDGSKAIRGGVPICWPWFGPSQIAGEPQHGYARLATWDIIKVLETENSVTIELAPQFNQELSFSLSQTLVFSDSLSISLTTQNTSSKAQQLTQAIHSYFNVNDIHQTSLTGLKGCQLYDQLTHSQHVVTERMAFNQHIDAIVETSGGEAVLSTLKGNFIITGEGYDSIVVWNPWQRLATSMTDFDDEGYKEMLCVEMANTHPVELAPGQSHTLTQTIKFNAAR